METFDRRKLDALMDGIKTMRHLLKRLAGNCRCSTLEQCGEAMFRSACARPAPKPVPRAGRNRIYTPKV